MQIMINFPSVAFSNATQKPVIYHDCKNNWNLPMTVCCVSADNKKSRLNKLNNSVDSHTKVDNVILV